MAGSAPRGGYVPLGALPSAADLSITFNRLTIPQLKPLLQILNAAPGGPRKQDTVDRIISTLAQRVASYNEALRGSQANVVELYWRQLREVVDKVNSSGKGAKLTLLSAAGNQVLPTPAPGQNVAASAAAHAASAPVRYAPASAPPPPLRPSTTASQATVPVATNLTNTAWNSAADPHGLKRKREDDSGAPAAKRQNLGSSVSSAALSSSGYIPPAPVGYNQARSGFLPNTNVCLEEVDDPFFRLAPYPALASFQLDAAISMNAAAPRSRAFNVTIAEPIWAQMQGPNGLRAILRCFVITPVRGGQPVPEPAKHSWPHGAYIFINQQYVELTKLKKDEKKKTLEMPLEMNPWLKPGINQVTIQATGMMNYQVAVQLMRPIAVTDMVEQTRARATISYEDGRRHVLTSFRGNGDDLMEMKKKVALSDPLVLTRIRIPARPSTCRHIGCFDLTNFLLMNERVRTWRCPVCGSDAPFKSLIVDGWMQHILTALGPDETEFVVYPDATWTDEKGRAPGGQAQPAPSAPALPPPPTRHVGTPSVTPASARPKPVSVITLDDSDDDDEPAKPPQKQYSPAGISSDPEYSGRGNLNSSVGSNSSRAPSMPVAASSPYVLPTADTPQADWRRATTVYPAAPSLERAASSQTVAPAQTREQSFEWMKPSNTSQDDIQIDVIDLTDD